LKPDGVRTCHDEWVKRILEVWLDSLGEVVIDARIAGVSRHGDVLFTEQREDVTLRRVLGVLGELARGQVLFEPFRNPVTPAELQSCVLKAIDLNAQARRAARRAKRKASTVQQTSLVVITPSMSEEIRTLAELTRVHEGKPGIYRLARLWSALVVVVDELGREASTVWLRLLGRGRVQAQAVEELLKMSSHEPLRDATFELLVAWQQNLPLVVGTAEGENDMLENWREIYARWERKVTREGRREEKAHAVMTVLEARGLKVTDQQRKKVTECSSLAQLEAWLRAAVTAPDVDAVFVATRGRRRVAT
jgi:hypothetical protein